MSFIVYIFFYRISSRKGFNWSVSMMMKAMLNLRLQNVNLKICSHEKKKNILDIPAKLFFLIFFTKTLKNQTWYFRILQKCSSTKDWYDKSTNLIEINWHVHLKIPKWSGLVVIFQSAFWYFKRFSFRAKLTKRKISRLSNWLYFSPRYLFLEKWLWGISRKVNTNVVECEKKFSWKMWMNFFFWAGHNNLFIGSSVCTTAETTTTTTTNNRAENLTENWGQKTTIIYNWSIASTGVNFINIYESAFSLVTEPKRN